MQQTATNLKAKLFRGLSDPSRLSILEALRTGPTSVSELVVLTGLSQPNVSNKLCCLKECGLVIGEQRGKFIFYRLNSNKMAALMEATDALLNELSGGFAECQRYE
jgi:DNA-binding transcriptional ArsR family regulator